MERGKDIVRNLGLTTLVAVAIWWGMEERAGEGSPQPIGSVENRINVVMPFDKYPVRLKVNCEEGRNATLQIAMPRDLPILPSRTPEQTVQNRNLRQSNQVKVIGACMGNILTFEKHVTFNPAEISRVEFTQIETNSGGVFGTTIAYRREIPEQRASVVGGISPSN